MPFDNISHDWMMKFLEHRIADRRMLRLLKKWLRAGVSEDGQWSPTTVGTPQGSVLAPVLSNLYLNALDHRMADASFVFLGYSFRGDKIYPRRESLAKMTARLTELTPRTRSGSIESIVKKINPILRGWFYYFRHCRWTIFTDLDAKLRGRLRRLLLKRHRRNPERLPRTHRWRNDYFAKAGLISLREAHLRFAQSHSGNY